MGRAALLVLLVGIWTSELSLVLCQQDSDVVSCIAPPGGKAVLTVVGEMGPSGPEGALGPKGSVGPLGPKGMQGEEGLQGPVGPQGAKGEMGSKGAAGRKGMKGSVGPSGLQGPDGVPGLPGATGSRGHHGPDGPHGPVGAPGLPGSPGQRGPQGETVLTVESERELLASVVQRIDSTQLGYIPFAASCRELYERGNNQSGYYFIGSHAGSVEIQYCEMEIASCGDSKAGWVAVAQLNMEKNVHQNCPGNLQLVTNSSLNRRACARSESSGGCSTLTYSTNGDYSVVCGRIRGYQHRTPDGMGSFPSSNLFTDGVAITRGSSAHQVWSFVAGLKENGPSNHATCPCMNSPSDSLPPSPKSAMGNNYFCESGLYHTPEVDWHTSQPFWDDPLWDGAGCPPGNNCCDHTGWFHRAIGSTSTDDIDVHLCRDQGPIDEDVYIDIVEVYVR